MSKGSSSPRSQPAVTAAAPSILPTSLLNFDPTTLIPTPALLIRSIALISVILSAIVFALGAWIVFYRTFGVGMGESEVVWLQYGYHRPPYADIALTPAGAYFASNQEYDVTLDIVVPSSTRNVELGNFMVHLALSNRDTKVTLNVSRPASLAYRSPISLALSALSPTALFRSPDLQHLSIPLASSQILRGGGKNPYYAYVELGRQDAHWKGGRWEGGRGELQVYQAKLRFDAHLTGLGYLLYHHPILLFLIYLPTVLFLELFFALLLWGLLVLRSSPSRPSTNNPHPPPPPEEKPQRIKRETTSESFPATSTTSGLDPFSGPDRVEERARREARLAAAVRSGIRMGGVEQGDGEEEGEGEGESEGGMEEGESWEEAEREEVNGKEDEEGSIVGSTTTRGSLSTFGPSMASTAASSSIRSRNTGRS